MSLLMMVTIAFVIVIGISATYGMDAYWRDFNGTIPSDAIIHGEDQLIGQGLLWDYRYCAISGSVLPGQFIPENLTLITNACDMTVTFIDIRRIKILCSSEPSRFYWKRVNLNNVLGLKREPYVIGGMEDDTSLYIGKVFHDNQWKIGKVFPPNSPWRGLQVWNNSNLDCCYKTMDFMILTYQE